MDEIFVIGIIVIALILIGFILGIVAFFRTGALRREVENLTQEVSKLRLHGVESSTSEGDLYPQQPDLKVETAPEPVVEPSSEPELATTASVHSEKVTGEDNVSDDVGSDNVDDDQTGEIPTPREPKLKIDTESAIGGKLSIWIGGLVLALGGIYLAKYAIDAGYLGPKTRVTLGFAFGLIVAGVGEWSRRRQDNFSLPGFESANIPSILSGAGIFIMFGAIYAAHALYGLIGPTTSFIILAILALASMFIALLHGPILAALGLAASYAVPFLINTDTSNVPILAIYILLVSASALYVAWYRGWLWLALLSIAAMFAYALPIQVIEEGQHLVTVKLYLLGAYALAFLSLVWSVHKREPEENPAIDWIASAALSILCLPILFQFVQDQHIAGHIVELIALVALPFSVAFFYPSIRYAVIVPSFLSVLKFWSIQLTYTVAFNDFNFDEGAQSLWRFYEGLNTDLSYQTYSTLGVISIIALLSAVTFFAKLTRSRLVLTIASTVISLAIFAGLYARLGGLSQPLQFAIGAVLLFIAFNAMAKYFEGKLDNTLLGRDGVIATVLIGSLLSLTIVISIFFDGIGLTIALGLITALTMWTYLSYPLTGLRIFAVLAIIPYAIRLLWQPLINPQVLIDAAPIFNILLLGYGVPALGMIFASYIATRYRNDIWAQILQAASIILSVITVALIALHVIDPEFIFASYKDALAASATMVMVGGAFSLGLTRVKSSGKAPVLRWMSEGLGILGMAFGALSLCLVLNPLLPIVENEFAASEINLGGGILINLIGYAYALPFLLFGLIIWQGKETKSKLYQWVALGFTAILAFLWINLTIRQSYHPATFYLEPISQSENYTYSLVWLIIGIAVLYAGIQLRSQMMRKISAIIIVAVVLKAFLIDMSNLEGILRALSFIGLGVVLMGIGFVYQRALRGQFDHQNTEGEGEAKGGSES